VYRNRKLTTRVLYGTSLVLETEKQGAEMGRVQGRRLRLEAASISGYALINGPQIIL
jgi:hypothetical protein